jgi:hypothetical protein
MDRTQRLRTLGGTLETGPTGSEQPFIAVLVSAMLIVAMFAYVILRAGPEVVALVGPFMATLPGERSVHGWIAPSVAVGTLLLGGSLAAVIMAAFVRGVRSDPFRWLAPVLIAFSSIVMTRLGLERSMGPLPASLFGALTALLLLGGGVLVQTQGALVSVSGGVLLTLPVLGLVLDQAHSARGLSHLVSPRNMDSLLALMVLALTSVGVGLTAFVGRPNGSLAGAIARSRDATHSRQQLAHALERARVSELRLAAAEDRAHGLEQALSASGQGYGGGASYADPSYADEEAAFAAAARPQNARRWFIAVGLFVIGASAGAVGLHMALVQPLTTRLTLERDAATKAVAAAQVEGVAAVKAELEGERSKAASALSAEKLRADTAAAELAKLQTQLSAVSAPAVVEEKKAEPVKAAPKASARRAKAAAKRAAASKAKVAGPASGSGLREAVSDDPIGGLE